MLRYHSLTHSIAAGLATRSEDNDQSLAGLCDGGLPDNDVCNVLDAAPIDKAVLLEAWSRG